MDCPLIQHELVSYHFGTTSEELSAQIDAHLLGCPRCLRAYLGIKRHIEQGASLTERPRPAVRERLRAAVGDAFRPSPRQRLRRWLGRPIPLYQGLAAAALALMVAAATPFLVRRAEGTALQSTRGESIDTSRQSPESLAFY